MTDRDALLRAIALNPAEDTPRLMYADLLDDLGGAANTARARFIRLQVETHRGPGDSGGTWRFDQLTAEAKELGQRFGEAWLAELPPWVRPFHDQRGAGAADVFSRGFVERVRANPKQFVLRSADLFDVNPIRTLEIRGGPSELLPVFGCSSLGRLRALLVRGRGSENALASAVASSSHLAALVELDVSGCALHDRDARILSRSERLSGLRVIRARDNRFGVDAAYALAGSAKLPNLQEIDLRGGFIGPADGERFRARFPNKTVLV